MIRYRDLAAVVANEPEGGGSILTREEAVQRLLAHQLVVERVMREMPVLPIKFGTVLPDEAAVTRLLCQGHELLRQRFDEVSDNVQIELVVTCSLQDVLGEIAADDSVARTRSEFAARPGGASDAERAELGRMVKILLDRKRGNYAERIADALAPLVSDMMENALLDDEMVANFALLVPRDAVARLDTRIEELDHELEGRLNFRSIGPLPPYSFATVEVTQPAFDVIDRARQALKLSAQARPDEIKSAYRSLLQRTHPDVSSSSGDPQERVAELTHAYKLLMSYASARVSAAADEPDLGEGHLFGREVVERTIMIAVRRQEPAAGLQGASS